MSNSLLNVISLYANTARGYQSLYAEVWRNVINEVERIELYHVSVPLDKPFFSLWLPGYLQTHVRYTLIRAFTSDGLVGVSAGNAFAG